MSAAPAPGMAAGPAEPAAGRGEARGGAGGVIQLSDERQRVKKVTSGSEKRQRTQSIRIRVHPADGERLKIEAAAAGMSVAGYLASGRLGPEAAPRPRMRRRQVAADMAAFTQAMVEFRRAANLLNQQTRAQNTLALFAKEHGAGQLLDAVRELGRGDELLRDEFKVALAALHAALANDREG
jgi:hypothetical protein